MILEVAVSRVACLVSSSVQARECHPWSTYRSSLAWRSHGRSSSPPACCRFVSRSPQPWLRPAPCRHPSSKSAQRRRCASRRPRRSACCRPAGIHRRSSRAASAFSTRSPRSCAARCRAAALRLSVVESSSASSCCFNTFSWSSACFRHFFRLRSRRNEAAPALARTRVPSCATRFSFTTPACISTASSCVSSPSSAFAVPD